MSRGKAGSKKDVRPKNRLFQAALRAAKRLRKDRYHERQRPPEQTRLADREPTVAEEVMLDELLAQEVEVATAEALRLKRSKKKGTANFDVNMKGLGFEPDDLGGWKRV